MNGVHKKRAKNNNPWNVGQFDSLDAKWITVKGYPTLAEWVLAVAENFRKKTRCFIICGTTKEPRTKSIELSSIHHI